MSSIWGDNIKLSIFGESHGEAIGITIDGLPPGIQLDMDNIKMALKRRAPGRDELSTSRLEKDGFEMLSGYFMDKTTGSPLTAIIRNTNADSKDYEKIKALPRPGHGDYPGNIKYFGHNDYRGGGHFSARITAPLVFAGAIASQILKTKGIIVGSHIKSIGQVEDSSFDYRELSPRILESLKSKRLPTIDEEKAKLMERLILDIKEADDSIGGVVEIGVINPIVGLGSPFFHSVESKLSQMIFSIPGVKGIEFGQGFNITKMKGSEANDEFYIEENRVKTYTNNNGGILGGLSNGMPIIFRVALKPTPSIGKTQRTIDMVKKENREIKIDGRHDPCIVVRALPILEAATAIVILDLLIDLNKNENFMTS